MRVNSPAPEPVLALVLELALALFPAPWPELSGETGLCAATGLAAPAPPPDSCPLRNIRVNSPGPVDAAAGGAALCNGAGGALGFCAAGIDPCPDDALGPIELNIRVNAPGSPEPAGAAISAGGAPPASAAVSPVGVFGGFSIATGLKTRATWSVFPVLGAAPEPVSGVVRAFSIRVNSPGELVSAGGAGAAAGCCAASTGAEAGIAGEETGAAEGASCFTSGSSFAGEPCCSSDASRSSSARGADCTCPKIPVALDGCPALDGSEGSKGFVGGFLGASIGHHLAWRKSSGSGFQHYIDLA